MSPQLDPSYVASLDSSVSPAATSALTLGAGAGILGSDPSATAADYTSGVTDPTGDISTLERNLGYISAGAGGTALPPSYALTAATSNLGPPTLASMGANYAAYRATGTVPPPAGPVLPQQQATGFATPMSADHAASGAVDNAVNALTSNAAPAPGKRGILDALLQDTLGAFGKSQVGKDVNNVSGKLMVVKHMADRFARWSETQPWLMGEASRGVLAPAEAAWLKGQSPGPKATIGQVFAEEIFGQHRGVDASGQLQAGSMPFHLLSGTVDALIAMSTDPLKIIGDSAKVARLAARAPTDAAAVDALMSSPRTVQAAKRLAQMDNAGAISRLSRAYGWGLSDGVISDVAKAGTTDEVLATLADHAMTEGRGAMAAMPQFYSNAALRQLSAIHEWRMPLFSTATAIKPGKSFDLLSPKASGAFRDLVGQWLPGLTPDQVDTHVADFISATQAGKGDLVDQVVRDGMHRLGYTDEEIAHLAERKGLKAGSPKLFGVNIPDPTKPLLQSQVRDVVTMPDARDYLDLKAAKMQGALGKVARAGLKGEDIAHAFTRRINPLWLAHPSWATKVGMDETLATLARNPEIGGLNWARQVGASFIDDLTHSPGVVRGVVGNALESFWRGLADLPGMDRIAMPDLPPAGVDVPESLLMGAHANEWMDTTRAPTPSDVKEARDMITRATGGKPREVPDGWKIVDKTDEPLNHAVSYYQIVNHQLRNDPVANAFIHHYATQDALSELEQTYFRTGADGTRYLSGEGKRLLTNVDRGPAIRSSQGWVNAMESHITTIGKLVNDMLPGETRQLASIGPLGFDDIQRLADTLPQKVWGFNLVPPPAPSGVISGAYENLMNHFFGPMSHMLDSVVRKPLWRSLYQSEYDRLGGLARSVGATLDEEKAAQSAATFATRQLAGTVHNPAERTALDVWTRSIFPFNFARVQAIKRWGRVAVDNPGFLRAMHLFNNSFTSDGVFHKDSFGNSVFSVPIPAEFYPGFMSFKVGTDTSETPLPLKPIAMLNSVIQPPMLPFSGDVQPGFGAALTLPVSMITSMKPRVEEVRSAILGPGFSQASYPGMSAANRAIQAVAPSWLSNLSRAVHGDPGDASFANAFKDAMAWAIWNGKNPEDPATKAAIMGQTRQMYLMRAASSLFSPYAQTPDFSGMAPVQELRQLQADHGNSVGTHLFVQKYGDRAVGFTTGKTAAVAKDVYPTPEAEGWMNANGELMKKYPNTGGYFAPQGTFDPAEIAKQVADGHRKVLSPDEWIAKIMIPAGNDAYYNRVKPLVTALRAAGVDSRDVTTLENTLLQQIDDAHPGWLAYHNQGAERAFQRQADIKELLRAANDPGLADNATAAATRQFGAMFTAFTAFAQAQGTNLAAARMAPLVAALKARGDALAAEVPDFKGQWTYLWEPEIGVSDTATADTAPPVAGAPTAGAA